MFLFGIDILCAAYVIMKIMYMCKSLKYNNIRSVSHVTIM